MTDWGAAVRSGFGVRGLLWYRLASGMVLVPSLVLAGYALCSGRSGLWIWVVLAGLGYRAGSPGPTGIGLLVNLGLAASGLVVALLRHEPLHLGAGLLPGATWCGACAVRGTTATYILEKLQAEPDYFAALVARGLLVHETSPP